MNLLSWQLTESLAMLPAASVSGLYFANPEAKVVSLKIQLICRTYFLADFLPCK